MNNIGPVIKTPDEELEIEEIEISFSEGDDDEEEYEVEILGHYDNIVDTLNDDDRASIAGKVIEDFENDSNSRREWARSYVRGMELLGLKIEDRSSPWPGASGVFHPVLMESIIRFQAQSMGELYPASGPARTKIVGKQDKKKLDLANRVEREMNYQTTENMVEYREEMEQMLFHLPMAGSAFKKVFFDPVEKRPVSMFVPAEDLVVSYGATSLMKAERFTHVMKKTEEEIRELMDVGFYSDVEIGNGDHFRSDIQEMYDELSGEEPSYSDDTRLTILEAHCMMDVEEDRARPYIITVDKSSGELLSVRRNWKEGDATFRRIMHFVHYKYLPGLGFYGIGLIHLLGGLTKTATSVLRQLIDSGTLANLPAGFKTRGFRVKGDNTPFMPGEFRDVDVPSGAIRDHIEFIPYKEPSTVLHSLLGDVISEARRIGAVAEAELTNLSKEMPVGTAFAILERQLKVMTGVQARMHAALKRELGIISRIVGGDMDEVYEWDEERLYNRKEDFSSKVDVIPVSDPNASTTAQKVVSYQAAMEMAGSAPQLYNMGKLHRQMLDVLQIDNADEIVKLPEDISPADPVTENMAILKQEPVKAFMYQDHEAHIRVHMAAAEDPKIQQIIGQSPFASAIQAAMASHVTEHVAMEYRKQIEKNLGVSLPSEKEELPEDVEIEISRMAQQAADKLLGKNQAEMQAMKAQEEAQDPLNIIQRKELEIKEAEQRHNAEMDMLRLELDAFTRGGNLAHMKSRLDSEEARAAGNMAMKLATTDTREDKNAKEMIRLALEQARLLQDSGKIQEDDAE